MTSQFLASELTVTEQDKSSAKFRIIPVPLEKTVSYGSGTALGPAAIIEASNELERICAGSEPCAAGIYTEPMLNCEGSLHEIMQSLASRTKAVVANNSIPVTIGGEHSLTYGAVQGVIQALQCEPQELGIIQIDAHADLREAYQGEVHSHASVMQLLAKEGVKLAQFGVRALCQEEVDARKQYGVFFKDAEELVVNNINKVPLPENFPKNIYISYDLDGLDPSEMPATGTPVPGGLSFYQSLHLVSNACHGRNIVGIDVVELAPIAHQQGWNFTAAQVIYRLMAMI